MSYHSSFAAAKREANQIGNLQAEKLAGVDKAGKKIRVYIL
jgi:hypothetical protein